MAGYIVPTANSIEKILEALYGPGLTVTPNDDASLLDRHVATYVSEDQALVAIGACDAAFVAYSGAALTMVPADAANDMISSHICSRLLMSDDSPHLRLDETLAPGSAAQAVSTAESLAQAASFSIEIPQDGNGNSAFRIA